jgi:MFS family permease
MEKAHLNEKTALLKTEHLTEWQKFKESVAILKQSPKDLYIAYAMKTCSFAGFFCLGFVMTLYLTKELGFSDMEAGILFAMTGVAVAIYSILLGSIPDKVGIRKSMFLAQGMAAAGLLIIILVDNRWVQVTMMLGPILSGLSLSIPIIILAVKRFTLPAAQSLAFSVLYMFIWLAAGISGMAVEIILISQGLNKDSFRMIFIMGLSLTITTLILSFYISEIDIRRAGNKELENYETLSVREVLGMKKFWRFMILSMLLVVVRAIFTHLGTTLPLYMDRELGDNAHFGAMLALHAIVMMVGVIVFTGLIYFMSNFALIWIGGCIASASPLFLVLGGNYLTISLFVIMISIGESIWAPRMIDYTLEVAPHGREGLFLSVSSSPFALSMIVAGMMSGTLLSEFCPEDGERECWKMWLIIGITTLISPIFILLFWAWLEQPHHESYPYIPCVKDT